MPGVLGRGGAAFDRTEARGCECPQCCKLYEVPPRNRVVVFHGQCPGQSDVLSRSMRAARVRQGWEVEAPLWALGEDESLGGGGQGRGEGERPWQKVIATLR